MGPIAEIGAGVALIFFGVRFLRKGLIRAMGSKLDLWLEDISRDRLGSAFAGGVFGIFAPSSTTQSILALNMVKAGKLPVKNLLVFLLFANAGITVSIQLIALQIQSYYPIFLILGVSAFLLARKSETLKGLGQILTAFGFIFLAMTLLGTGSRELLSHPNAAGLLQHLGGHQFWIAGLAALASVLCQTSMAVIGIALSVGSGNPAASHLLLPVVLGSTLGIGITTLLVGWGICREEFSDCAAPS